MPWSHILVGVSACLLGLGVLLFDPYLLSILNAHDILDRAGPWDLDWKAFLLIRYIPVAENIASAAYWSDLMIYQVDWVVPLLATPTAFLATLAIATAVFMRNIWQTARIIGAGVVVLFFLVPFFHFAALAVLLVIHFTNFWFLILLIMIVQMIRYRRHSLLDT